jgi:hypothetical protein
MSQTIPEDKQVRELAREFDVCVSSSVHGFREHVISGIVTTFLVDFCVQTGSEAHPASRPMGAGFYSLGVKRGRGVMLTTQPHLVPRLRMCRSYTSSPPQAGSTMACSGTPLPS